MGILDLNDEEKVEGYEGFVGEDGGGEVREEGVWGEVKGNWGDVYV